MSQRIRLDLNAPTFQADFVGLETDDLRQTAKTFRKLLGMTWDAVYRDQGLKWEEIRSAKGTYTLRIKQQFHQTMTVKLCSRSAANAKQARISVASSSG